MKQIQKQYDAVAPVQDMRAQLREIVPFSAPHGTIRIAKAFFGPPSTRGAEDDVDWPLSIVDDMVLLYIRQEGVPQSHQNTSNRRHQPLSTMQSTLPRYKLDPELPPGRRQSKRRHRILIYLYR